MSCRQVEEFYHTQIQHVIIDVIIMCGIVGFAGKKNYSLLRTQLESIRHRGKDDTAAVFSHGLNFGMNRLAIIDLTKGLYPMRYKHYILLYNGEIYNYKILRKRLMEWNITCKTSCDAEVILPLYDRFGHKAFSMLEGMFAVCILDTKQKSVILCRDKAGEKPLYYFHRGSTFVFGSEIKSILLHSDVPKSIDRQSLQDYASQGYSHTNSLISGVVKVLPSQCVEYSMSSHTVKSRTYWNIPHERHTSLVSPLHESVNELNRLLEQSVNLRLIADVPVGCFLSGGIDSSIITLFATKKQPDIHTFSVSFPSHAKDDESYYASSVAKWLKTKHTVVECTPGKVVDLIQDIGKLVDDPISDPAFLPTLIMAKEARKKVKVVLTGEGADELFAGYPRYPKHLVIEAIRHSPPLYIASQILSALTGYRRLTNISKKIENRVHTQHIWKQEEIRTLLNISGDTGNPYRYIQYGDNNILLSMQATDFRGYLAEQLLMKVDKATMAENLEARAPYLDSDIIDFVFRIPQNYKLRGLKNKYILRVLAEQYFPKWFAWRPKHGFSVPLGQWFRKELKSSVLESLDTLLHYRSVINAAYYKKSIDDHMELRSDNSDKIWSMIVLAGWLKHNKISQ